MNKASWITTFSLTALLIVSAFATFTYKAPKTYACSGDYATRVGTNSNINSATLEENCYNTNFIAISQALQNKTITLNCAQFWRGPANNPYVFDQRCDSRYSRLPTNWGPSYQYGQAAESILLYLDNTYGSIRTAFYGLL